MLDDIPRFAKAARHELGDRLIVLDNQCAHTG
jgi:hypothetical protein